MQETPQIAEKWHLFKATGCQKTRGELIEHYLPLAAGTAHALMVGASPRVRFDELESAAQLGLVQAVDAYKVGGGASFPTFSWRRMRGAILDWQRSMAWGPRYARDDVPAMRRLDLNAYYVADDSNPVRCAHLADAANRASAHTSRPNAESMWLHANGKLDTYIAVIQGVTPTGVFGRRGRGAAEIRSVCRRKDYVWD